jgi:hypothetical protein
VKDDHKQKIKRERKRERKRKWINRRKRNERERERVSADVNLTERGRQEYGFLRGFCGSREVYTCLLPFRGVQVTD